MASVTKVESGGRLWRPIVNRVLTSLVFMSLLMILTIGLSQGWIRAISAAPPIAMVIVFKLFLNRKFNSFHYCVMTDAEVANAPAHHNDASKHRLAKRFGCVSVRSEEIELIVSLSHPRCAPREAVRA